MTREPETTKERLAKLAMTDPIAHAALAMHERGGATLETTLITAAEAWSQRCREAYLERLDTAIRQPPAPIVLVTPEADIERLKARLKAIL